MTYIGDHTHSRGVSYYALVTLVSFKYERTITRIIKISWFSTSFHIVVGSSSNHAWVFSCTKQKLVNKVCGCAFSCCSSHTYSTSTMVAGNFCQQLTAMHNFYITCLNLFNIRICVLHSCTYNSEVQICRQMLTILHHTIDAVARKFFVVLVFFFLSESSIASINLFALFCKEKSHRTHTCASNTDEIATTAPIASTVLIIMSHIISVKFN